MAKPCFCCPDLSTVLPTHGQHGNHSPHTLPTCVSTAYMVTAWLLFIKPAHGTGKLSDPESPGVYHVNVTSGKYSHCSEWLLVLRTLFHYSHLLSELQHVCSHCCHNLKQKYLPAWRLPKAQGGGKKMFPCYLMLPNSFWWQLCLAPRTAHKVELFSLGSWWHGITGLFTSEKGWPWRKQNIRCCLEQQESSLHFKSTAA